MNQKQHLLLGLLFSSVLVLAFPRIGLYGFLIIFLSSVLVDVDHYIYYVYKTKNFSVKNAWSQNIERIRKLSKIEKKDRGKYKYPIIIFHGVEFLVVLLLIALVNRLFFFIFLGATLHLICDLRQLINHGDTFHQKFSQVYTFIRNKKLKNLTSIDG